MPTPSAWTAKQAEGTTPARILYSTCSQSKQNLQGFLCYNLAQFHPSLSCETMFKFSEMLQFYWVWTNACGFCLDLVSAVLEEEVGSKPV